MENFIVSARKYRPATFDRVVGQTSITTTLKNAIKNNHLAQAFLFCGPRGVGKTTCARILAKTINCENINDNIEACDKCESCTSFNESHSFNIHELDAASNNHVDDIRNLIEQVRVAPQVGKYSIYIIDEVHMLSLNAFNAFLKTLEEPPSYAIFILATTTKQKIIPTILSRCQIFDFSRIQIDDIANHLTYVAENEKVQAESDALHVIAQKADGSLRDALSIFDQMVSYSVGKVDYKTVIESLNILDYDYYFKIGDYILNHNISSSLLIFDEILNNGFDGHNFVTGLSEHFRNLLVCKDEATLELLQVSGNVKDKYKEQSGQCSAEFLLTALDISSKSDINYNNSVNQRLHVELMLMQLCSVGVIEGTEEKMYSIMNAPTKEETQVVNEPKPIYNKPEDSDPKNLSEKNETVNESIESEEDVSADVSSDVSSGALAKEEATVKEEAEEAKGEPEENDKQDKPKGNKEQPAKTRTISLSSFQNKEESEKEIHEDKEEENNNEGVDLKTVGSENLLKAWNEYAEQIHKSGKHSLYSTLTVREPIIKTETEIELTIDNAVQEKEINDEKLKIYDFLKEQLGLSSVHISTVIIKDDTEKKPYTSMEKFKRMAEKNPSIDKLRQQLNLDIDF